MSRTRLTWSDDELVAIMDAIRRQDRAVPHDNARFLDGLIQDVRVATGRLYGAGTYARLLHSLAEMTGVARRPSTSTIQKAIARAQAGAPREMPSESVALPLNEDALKQALAPMLQALVGGKACEPGKRLSGHSHPSGEDARRAQLAEASLSDALRRLQAAEGRTADLQRQLATACARAEVAELHTAGALASILEALGRAEVSAAVLANVARELAGTERFLKVQNDAVRMASIAEAERLKERVAQLERRVDQLLIENDQYRRASFARVSDR